MFSPWIIVLIVLGVLVALGIAFRLGLRVEGEKIDHAIGGGGFTTDGEQYPRE